MLKYFSHIKKTWYLVLPYWQYGTPYMIGSLFFNAIVAPAKALVNVWFIQTVLDMVGRGASFGDVCRLIALYFVINLTTILAQRAFDVLYAEKKLVQIRRDIELKILHKTIVTDYKYFDDPAFYDTYTLVAKEYVARVNEAQKLFVDMCSALSTIVSMFAFISVMGPLIIVISLVQLTVSMFIDIRKNKINFARRNAIIPEERKTDYVHRTFYNKENAADIKCTRAKDYLLDMYNVHTDKKVSIIQTYAKKLFGWMATHEFITAVYNAGILGYISYSILVTKSIDGVGKFMGLLAANSQLITSLHSFYKFISQSVHLSLYADKIISFFATESKIEAPVPSKPTVQPAAGPFEVEFRNVGFSYNHSNFCLRDVNLTIKPGERVAIVGENGAGKTTLSKLLLRLYDVSAGELLLNGQPIQRYDLSALREQVGVSFQKPNLYAISFADNVNMYREADEAELQRIAASVGLQAALQKSGAGVNTPVTKEFSEEGIILSGGEMQKLGIARLLGAQFGLLIFDEPSAALDPLAEDELMELIYSSANTSTSIIIAHRLSTVVKADRIYVMKDGRICESGTHDALLRQKGLYYEMFSVQSRKYGMPLSGPCGTKQSDEQREHF